MILFLFLFSGNKRSTIEIQTNQIYHLPADLNTLSVSAQRIIPSFSHCKLLSTPNLAKSFPKKPPKYTTGKPDGHHNLRGERLREYICERRGFVEHWNRGCCGPLANKKRPRQIVGSKIPKLLPENQMGTMEKGCVTISIRREVSFNIWIVNVACLSAYFPHENTLVKPSSLSGKIKKLNTSSR